jgi:arginine decarboxylase
MKPDTSHPEPELDLKRLHLWNMASREEVNPGFHMPGHAGARHFSREYRNAIISLDTTELLSSDDLHDPQGPALLAMKESSRIYGSGETLFVTTGSTTGIQVMLASICTPGTFLLLPRQVHFSVLHALALLDCPYAFFPASESPNELKNAGIFPQVTEEQVRQSFLLYPQTTDVLLVSPDYYGQCADLATLAEIIHSHECRLLVDEAHGAHITYLPEGSPLDAMSSHADMCVQSLHKTLPALTMASQIHISKEAIHHKRVSVRRVWDMLRLLETSSPSFVIAASIEYAVAWMEMYGRDALRKRTNEVQQFLLRCIVISGIRVFESDFGTRHDPMRIVLQVDPSILYAPDLMEALAEEGTHIEFADLTRLVLIVSPWHQLQDFDNLFATLLMTVQRLTNNGARTIKDIHLTDELMGHLMSCPSKRVIGLRDAFFGGYSRKQMDLLDAAGETCALPLIPYPPGIPILWPGEVISPDLVSLIERLCERKMTVRGVENGKIDVLCL